jgi:hypothetical protein
MTFDTESRGTIGKRLTEENQQAVKRLVAPIADDNPLILTDQPAMNQIAGWNGIRLMTNHLLLFGAENKPLPEILREHGVRYLLLYSTSRWQSPFRPIADSLYVLIGEERGMLTDQARTYTEPEWQHLDTLRLYQARW